MQDLKKHKFNHLKVHTQYSICEGAIKIDNLKDFCKEHKIQAIGLSDTSNLCGALEFAENISKVGTQPIIGTQINFKFEETVGLIPIIAMNEKGYKKIKAVSYSDELKPDILEIHRRYQVVSHQKMKSSLKFCVVAAGEFDLYAAEPRAYEWDIAAGHAILIHAGGQITDFEGNDIYYGKPGLKNPSIILKNKNII